MFETKISIIFSNSVNQEVIFEPVSRKLYRKGTDYYVVLHTPAALCLYHLLSNKSDIISQDKLMKIGWNNKGGFVSINAYYQAINHIRKSFSEFGINDILITVPKRGLTVNPSYIVSIDNGTSPHNDNQPSQNKNALFAQDQLQKSNKRIEDSETMLLNVTHPNKTFHIRLSIIIALTLLALSTATIKYYNTWHNKGYFSSYTQFQHQQCRIYSSGYPENNHQNELATIKYHAINCGVDQDVYLTLNKLNKRESIMRCSINTHQEKSCESALMIGGVAYE